MNKYITFFLTLYCVLHFVLILVFLLNLKYPYLTTTKYTKESHGEVLFLWFVGIFISFYQMHLLAKQRVGYSWWLLVYIRYNGLKEAYNTKWQLGSTSKLIYSITLTLSKSRNKRNKIKPTKALSIPFYSF